VVELYHSAIDDDSLLRRLREHRFGRMIVASSLVPAFSLRCPFRARFWRRPCPRGAAPDYVDTTRWAVNTVFLKSDSCTTPFHDNTLPHHAPRGKVCETRLNIYTSGTHYQTTNTRGSLRPDPAQPERGFSLPFNGFCQSLDVLPDAYRIRRFQCNI